jgi:hypothetical protein
MEASSSSDKNLNLNHTGTCKAIVDCAHGNNHEPDHYNHDVPK